ncbi:hypothetical protein ACFWIB_15360 [Streptomyces sp. NPDC127051]|uniref:hypothetical protein n=1 Tax=Streptomyces sp. NPDC127051 TaxID=3347119 RepID=UPI0036510C71
MNDPQPLSDQGQLAGILLNLQESMAPIYDAADGVRAELLSRGWSPGAAEQAAATWLCAAIKSMWNQKP